MEIVGEFYKIEKLEDAPFYNLSLLTTINAGTEKERTEFKIVGYGMPFDSCIKRIVDYQLQTLEGEYTIKEYLEKYEEFVEIISNEFE
jgi:hypothetical protein